MMRRVRGAVVCAVIASALGWLLPAVASADAVTNGGFETGDFTGWQVQDESGSAGTWFVYSGTTAPLTGAPIPAPPEGNYAAISDEEDPTSTILYQDVTLPAGTNATLSLYAYYTSYAAMDLASVA